jgi:hypothetical protein
VELQGLSAFGARRRGLRGAVVVLAALAALVLMPAAASAWSPPGQTYPQSAPPGTPALVSSMTTPPVGYRLTGNQVLALARANPFVKSQLKKMPKTLVAYVYTRGGGVWQVSWFTNPDLVCTGTNKAGTGIRTTSTGATTKCHPQWEEIQVYVVDATGEVSQAWTGYQVAWTMARGYPGAFGKVVNHLWIWIPLCVLFLAPFLPWRRRPSLLHLDLLVLLGFSLSLAWFNHSNLGLSVPTIYPFMIYLMVRLGLLAFGIGRPKGPLRVVIPTPWLAILIIFLVGFRIGLNVTDSNVIDVGYAGTIGGYRILHGQKLYGDSANTCASVTTSTTDCWPNSNSAGDTYGPTNYFAYAPAVAIFGWSGTWDNSLPASHAAAIAFDLLTMIALFFLGRRIRGPSFGVILSYLWAAFPFTLYVLSSNSNDSLVALMVVLSLLVVTSAPARGIVAAFAGLTKFAPFVMVPLLLRGTEAWPPFGSRAFIRRVVSFVVPFAVMVLALMLVVLLNHDWHNFWEDTISYQFNRPAPFSIWGLWGDTFGGVTSSLKPEQYVWEALVVLGGVLAMIFPRGRRNVVQVAALGGALIIGVQCCLTYWFYLYIVWFFPLVIVALVLAHPSVESVFGGERAEGAQLSAPPVARVPTPV